MSIEIKKSVKPVDYSDAVSFLEKRVEKIIKKQEKELIWILEHKSIYTEGTSSSKNDILDKSINTTKSSRGGKITWHGPGQLICYFVIDLNKRKKDIRKFIYIIEKSIIDSLKEIGINSSSDRKNVGVWVESNNETKKIAAIGFKIKKWVAYHGFSLNINNDLSNYESIIPCGIKNKGVTNIKELNIKKYSKISEIIIQKLIVNLKV
tara:strand:+ start:24 stop:644 length:621 start_codon:yes stop_codon:yes gene_type:complete